MFSSKLLGAGLPAIADAMVRRGQPTKAGEPVPRVIEATFKEEVLATAAAPAKAGALSFGSTEQQLCPEQWPRLGGVDIPVERRPVGERPAAFIELKWSLKDGLWNCVWDVAKSALVDRLQLCDEALLLVGHGEEKEWQHKKYGTLLRSQRWEARDFQERFAAEWKYWARPPKVGEQDRTGPYALPAAFAVELLERHPFEFREAPWSLGLLRVTADSDAWTELDEWAAPVQRAPTRQIDCVGSDPRLDDEYRLES